MPLFYQGKLIEEYSKEELVEMVKELVERSFRDNPDKVARGEFKYNKKEVNDAEA